MNLALSHAQASLALCFVLWLGWTGWLAWEGRRHRRGLDRLRLRVHVNGTRGKSGVTRLIAAGLRAGGYRALAKVTGTEAKWIDPDGSERLIARRGPPNIREMVQAVLEAENCGADALVCECMALQPELQLFCERRLMRSHIGVITNIRHDHEEVMGTDLVSIAASLGGTIPERGLLVVAPQTEDLLQRAGVLGPQEARVRLATAASATELAEFPFEVEAENVSLALCVCELAGVDRRQALDGMKRSVPDKGNLAVIVGVWHGKKWQVVDAMAANDPESTRILWERYVGGRTTAGVLLHARADRRVRTQALCAMFKEVHAGIFYLTGDVDFAVRCLNRLGVEPGRIVIVEVPSLEAVLKESTVRLLPDTGAGADDGATGILFAAGNKKGFVA